MLEVIKIVTFTLAGMKLETDAYFFCSVGLLMFSVLCYPPSKNTSLMSNLQYNQVISCYVCPSTKSFYLLLNFNMLLLRSFVGKSYKVPISRLAWLLKRYQIMWKSTYINVLLLNYKDMFRMMTVSIIHIFIYICASSM